MFLTAISLFFLISSIFAIPAPLYADDFNIIGDSNFNQYRQATALSVGQMPLSVEDSPGISYDTNLVQGVSTTETFENIGIEDLTDMNGWKRIPGIADAVSGPPGTEVDIGYFFLNQTGHEVEVSKVVIPFSQRILEEGNWLNIALVNNPLPVQRNISVLWDSRNLTKSGLLKEYVGPGVLSVDMSGSLVLDTLTIFDPIQVLDIQKEVVDNGVKMNVVIKNVGYQKLENLGFEHLNYTQELTISPSQEISIEYILEEGEDLEHFQIENPNEQTECAIYGIEKYHWVETEGITILSFREDGGWVHGPYVIPEQSSFCITRIPYTMTSSHLGYAKVQEDDNMGEEQKGELDVEEKRDGEEEKVEEMSEEEKGTVLGIADEANREDAYVEVSKNNFVLPKTGVTY